MSTNLELEDIYLAKRNKIVVDITSNVGQSPPETVATLNKNLEALGYTLSQSAIDALLNCSREYVESYGVALYTNLRTARGSHRVHAPMYPNFPRQVMEASEAELYFNALVHYFSSMLHDTFGTDTVLPQYETEPRDPLTTLPKLTVIELGSYDDAMGIYTQLAGANSSLNEEDKGILRWFVENSDSKYLPDVIPQKEILALIVAWSSNREPLLKHIKTATDVLRIATVLSGGDVSLASPTKFKSFKRSVRRFLIQSLENAAGKRLDITEDLFRHKNLWTRLAERLHPGEFQKQYPKTAESFFRLRNEKYRGFNSKVELGLKNKQVDIDLLATRPGDFARRLDHVLRENPEQSVADKFLKVADQVATPVLLQVRQHFLERNNIDIRSFFPKGQVSKVQVSTESLSALPSNICDSIVKGVEKILVHRFQSLNSLGKVYVDPQLKEQLLPMAQRSASKSLRTLARGSRIALPEGDTIRFFIWWKNGIDRTDIDLSGAFLDENFKAVEDITYYNLRSNGCCHSGDITNAPYGASEFIDVPIAKAPGRYVVMCVNSYTHQPYKDLPECFAGWMMRSKPNSGEIFDARTVVDKVDLTGDTIINIPLMIDLQERKVIWMDLSLKSNPLNNLWSNRKGINLYAKAITKLNRTNLFDLFSLHAQARGTSVETAKDADTVFSLHEGITPFDQDLILSEYLQ